MKKIRISDKAINYIVGLLLALFVVFIWSLFQVSTDRDNRLSSYYTTALPPIDPQVSDSLPNYVYKKLKKEVKYSRNLKNGQLMEGSSYWFTGYAVQKRCDTCSGANHHWDEADIKDNLIRLNWWRLDTGSYDKPIVYYVKNGQSILRKTICELAKEQIYKNNLDYNCIEKDVPVPFRYDHTTQSIMVPVTEATMKIFNPVFTIFALGGSLICLYLVFTAFAKILMDIRDGEPFSSGNVKRFKWLTIFCFAVPIVLFLLNLLMWLVFHDYFTADIKLSSEAWFIFWKPFVLGLIFAALYSAFKRGKQLKEEQDLTI